MAIQWHPLLTQFLRQEYGDRLEIQEQVNLGELPLRADLVLIRRDLTVPLPHPFNHLGATTLVEFKGPGTVAGQDELEQLEIYGLLYRRQFTLPHRRDLTLWLVASKLAGNVSQREGAYLSRAHRVGPGVRGGWMTGFPTFLINLNQLPVNAETLPLLMVSRGRQERVLVEYVIEHRQEHSMYVHHLLEMHKKAFKEYLRMRELTLEQMGIEDVDEYIADVIKWVGEERLARKLSEQGFHKVIQLVGEEQVLRDLVSQLGVAKTRELLDKLSRESAGSEDN